MVIKYNSDIISSIFFLLLATFIWIFIPSQIDTMETTTITARTIPTIVTKGIFLFSFALLLQGVFKTPKKTLHLNRSTFHSPGLRKEMRSVLFAGLFIIYGILLTYTGYLISTSLLAIAILFYYKTRKWYYFAISLFTVTAVYGVFTMLLDVSLP